LQVPQYVLTDVAGNHLPMPARMSVRAAPHLVGMGLLEAVSDYTVQQLAEASMKDRDGAVGRVQVVPDAADPTVQRLGRFGWRGTSASWWQQTAIALNGDMGVTTSLLPKHFCGQASNGADCCAADANGPELNDGDLERMVRYASLLAVPPQRYFAGEQPLGIYAPTILAQTPAQTAAQEPAEVVMQTRVARGGGLFEKIRCTACHLPALPTGRPPRFDELRGQTIRPYTDLLLHDVGPALADNFPQGQATAQEWRTAPLWGIALLSSINPNVRYLHDGRAHSIEEAMLWHGGQGQASRDRFKAMSAANRQLLLDFLKSL
jgi:CxxC motif-containing protein (DUF1111 family)